MIKYNLLFRYTKRVILVGLLIGYSFIAIGPFLWALMMSFRSTPDILNNPYGITIPPIFSNYIRAFTEFNFGTYFRNSAFVTVMAIIISTLISSLAAYCFARQRYKFAMREVLFLIIFLTIMFPPQITLLSLYIQLWKYKLLNLVGLSLVYSATAMPKSIFILRSFYAQIPQEIEDATRVDGATEWQTFWRIMFPIARPATATIIVLNFIDIWNEFLFAVTFIHNDKSLTLPLGVMKLVGDHFVDFGTMSATLVFSIAPIIIIYSFLSEWFIKGMTAGAIKG
jgi:multiple sugar transport system permease protein/raffinose/stachyose/melibiose transport system permease protein